MAGINENVTYRSVVFHIQTEDMGPEMGMVVSTVFYSGMVIAKRQTSEKIDIKDYHEQTKRLLLSGAFDERARQIVGEGFKEVEVSGAAESSSAEMSLEDLLNTKILPALKYELGVILPDRYIERLHHKISRLEGQSRKEKFLKLCAEVYDAIKPFCPPERFKEFVKRLYTSANIASDEDTGTVQRSKKFFETVTMPELEEVLGRSLARALLEKILSDLHPMFLTKPEAFEVLIERILNSGVVKKRTSLQWRLQTKTIWKERYRSLTQKGIIIV